jgi:hypothetical protein
MNTYPVFVIIPPDARVQVVGLHHKLLMIEVIFKPV